MKEHTTYQVQPNAYALIGEEHGFKSVSDLVLIYIEPITDRDIENIQNHPYVVALDFSNDRNDLCLNGNYGL